MNSYLKSAAVAVLAVAVLGINTTTAKAVNVNCNNASIQDAVDNADGPTTININGLCVEDVTITKDDITLSGRPGMSSCNKNNPGGNGTIDGTVTFDGVRGRVEFLTITGSGRGLNIGPRALADVVCNDISDNEEMGVVVSDSSHATLRDNTLSDNGQQDLDDPGKFFDCGLLVIDASSVDSFGNTYSGNSYCGIEVDRQSVFKNGTFVPRRPGFAPDPNDKDVIIQRGCTSARA